MKTKKREQKKHLPLFNSACSHFFFFFWSGLDRCTESFNRTEHGRSQRRTVSRERWRWMVSFFVCDLILSTITVSLWIYFGNLEQHLESSWTPRNRGGHSCDVTPSHSKNKPPKRIPPILALIGNGISLQKPQSGIPTPPDVLLSRC